MIFEVAGAGVCLPAAEVAFESVVWGVAEEYGVARMERCRAVMPVPGVLQTVLRAEFWGAILALQAYWPCHLGIDYPNVARTAGRLLCMFTARNVRAVGQDVSPGKCVLLSTSKSVRKAMKLWDISGDGSFWKVQLDIRDLGGHLDFTRRARAGTLSCRVKEATVGVASVGPLPLGFFQVKLGLVRGKFIPAGLHAAEASYASSSSMSAFRAAIVRAVWSSKVPLANTLAIHNLLDGPVSVDPALHVVWVRFRMMRRYLAYCPEEQP